MIDLTSDKKEKKVEYVELIYDLIFVYIIGRNNTLLHHTQNGFVEVGLFMAYVMCTLAVIQIWTFTAYYINLYGRNGARDHIFMFVNMFLLYFIGEATRKDWQDYHTMYHIAWVLILLNIALQYAIEIKNHKGEPLHLKRIKGMITVLLGESLLVAAAIFEHNKFGTSYFSLAAILFGIIFVSVSASGKKTAQSLVDFPHLSERIMLYVVFTFGEMIIAIAGYFEGAFNLNSLYFCLMAFLIVVGLFLSYGTLYDRIIDREKQTSGIGYILIHIFIIFSLNNITAALEFMRDDKINLVPKILFLAGSVIIYYAFLLSTRSYAKQKCAINIKFYIKMLLIAASFVALMLLLKENMKLNIAVTVLYVYAVYVIIYNAARNLES
ncbi:MAG: low temperature requirement protein A [Ruminococcaceae bacterium]|nr:low temperature requirement protein A [Oscillospiraceae bacterium]